VVEMGDNEGYELRDLTANMRGKADGMLSMIDELLKISRLQSGMVSSEGVFFQVHDLSGVVVEANAIGRAKGIRMINDIPPDMRVFADPTLLREVLFNLLFNAIKFSHRGGTVRVFRPEPHLPELAVEDHGVGVEESRIDSLFRHEVKTTTLGTEGERGTGLGLPLCREMMEAMGGALRMESTPGEGTTIYMRFADVAPDILAVGCPEESLREIQNALQGQDIHLEDIPTLDEAATFMATKRPHVLIADFKLAARDNFRLLTNLQSEFIGLPIPVILLTNGNEGENLEAALRQGVSDFIRQPVNGAEALARIRRFIS